MDWILYKDPPRSGPYNMAKDEYCLQRARDERRGIVRFYQWEQLVLTLGRNQKVLPLVNAQILKAENIPLIRRITGGWAVLHGNDLTYSVSAPRDEHLFSGGIMAIYQKLSEVFLDFFKGLSLNPTSQAYSGKQRVELGSPVCFSTPSACEILIDEKKLVGSAQRQLPTVFLQHGSIPLLPQSEILGRIFEGESPEELAEKMTDLETLGVMRNYNLESLQERLKASFEKVLGITLREEIWGEKEENEVYKRMENYPPVEHPEKQ